MMSPNIAIIFIDANQNSDSPYRLTNYEDVQKDDGDEGNSDPGCGRSVELLAEVN